MKKTIRIIDWKPIKDYESLYEVSNMGEIRSLNHERKNKNGSYIQKGKILKTSLNKRTGYMLVNLSKNGKKTTKYIHKLVAETFIDNPNNFMCVNHKDEDKTNNCVDNLEWCTHKMNDNYGTRNKRISAKLSKKIQLMN